MKTKQIKAVAATVAISFGLAMVPAPVFAASTNIVSETKDKTTLTMSQIQDLAVIYNRSNESLALKMKELDLQEETLGNEKRNAESALNTGGYSDNSSSETIGAALEALKNKLVSEGKNPEEEPQYQALLIQYQSVLASEMAMQAQANSAVDSAISGIEQLEDNLDVISDGKDDLKKAKSDLETQMRLTAGYMAMSLAQADKSIALLEESVALSEKALEIAELQKELGMNIAIDVVSAKTSKLETENSLESAKESRDKLKRQINVMIGRNMGSPLEVIPMNMPVAIDPAPAYTDALVKEIKNVNYNLKTLERDKQRTKNTAKSDMGSDELKKIDNTVAQYNLDIKNKEEDIANELKALLTAINTDGAAYQASRDKYGIEQKNYEYAQLRFEQGMISQLELQQAELTLKQAELTNMQNGYKFYFDWQKFYAMEKGIDVSSLTF